MAYQRNGRWYTRVRINGQLVRKALDGCTNKRAAEMVEAKWKQEAFEGRYLGKNKLLPLPFREFVNGQYFDRHLKTKKSIRAFSNIIKLLSEFFEDTPLHEINYEMITRYKAEAEKEAPVGVNRYMALLHNVFECALLWNNQKTDQETKWLLPSHNPVKGIKRNQETPRDRFLIDEEIARLLSHAGYEKLRDIILLALLTGLRKGEIRNLAKKDLDFFHETILLPVTKSLHLGSTKRAQAVPMTPIVKQILGKYVGQRLDKPFDFDFKKAFNNAARTAAIKNIHFHDLRHTFATLLYKLGARFYTIARLLRHKVQGEARITTIYTAVMDPELRETALKLDAYFSENILIEHKLSTRPILKSCNL